MQRQLTTLACYFHSSVDICCRVGRVCMSELTCKLPTCEEQNRAIAVQHIFHGDAIIDSVVASTAYRNQVYHAVRTRTLRIIHPVYKIIIITQPVLYVRIISFGNCQYYWVSYLVLTTSLKYYTVRYQVRAGKGHFYFDFLASSVRRGRGKQFLPRPTLWDPALNDAAQTNAVNDVFRYSTTSIVVLKVASHPQQLIVLTICFSLPASRNSEPGSHSRLSLPSSLRFVPCISSLVDSSRLVPTHHVTE